MSNGDKDALDINGDDLANVDFAHTESAADANLTEESEATGGGAGAGADAVVTGNSEATGADADGMDYNMGNDADARAPVKDDAVVDLILLTGIQDEADNTSRSIFCDWAEVGLCVLPDTPSLDKCQDREVGWCYNHLHHLCQITYAPNC